MNYYIVVEGQAEKHVYKSWIPLINPHLSYVDNFSDVSYNNFYIVSGNGYPYFFKIISNGIEDVNNSKLFQKLIIAVDAEEMSYEEKYREIDNYIQKFSCSCPISIIIQYYCLETWGLGNRSVPKRNTTDTTLQTYFNFFNVIQEDPELMPSIDSEKFTRSQFAYSYLKKIINDRNSKLSYSKSNPKVLTQNHYFTQIRQRVIDCGHIPHFQELIDVFL